MPRKSSEKKQPDESQKKLSDKRAARKKATEPEAVSEPVVVSDVLGHPWGEVWGVVYFATGLLVFAGLVSHFVNSHDNILGPYLGTFLGAGLIALFGYLPSLFLPGGLFYAGVRIFAGNRLPIRELLYFAALWIETCILFAIHNIGKVVDPAFFPAPDNALGNLAVLELNKIFGAHMFGPYVIFGLLFIVTFFLLLRASMRYAIDVLYLELKKFAPAALTVILSKSVAGLKAAGAAIARLFAKKPKADDAESPTAEQTSSNEQFSSERYEVPENADIVDAEVIGTELHGSSINPDVLVMAPAGTEMTSPPVTPSTNKKVAPLEPAIEKSVALSGPAALPSSFSIGKVEVLSDAPAEIADEDFVDEGEQAIEFPISARKPDADTQGLHASTIQHKPSKPYELPPMSVLTDPPPLSASVNEEQIRNNALKIEETLSNFRIDGHVIKANPGPVITQYEIELAKGVTISSLVNRQDDIALAVGGKKIRVEAPIPGKAAVGIELPNDETQTVWFKHILASDAFRKSKAKLPIVVGRTISGAPMVSDITKMPHMLIAGQTGAGKSVGINSFICSLLMTKKPDELRLILIDPKKVEMAVYQGIPHLLSPVVTESEEAVNALKWAVAEMERRYRMLAGVMARNIESFNQKIREKSIPEGRLDESENMELPFIVVIIDELADLMMTASKDVEGLIQRIAQLARAVGIHLLVATQRPSVDIITGPIKANLPARIAFRTVQSNDSRTILGTVGSEKLLGRGDMLFLGNDSAGIQRYHGSYISEEDVEKITDFVKAQDCDVGTIDSFANAIDDPSSSSSGGGDGESADVDDYFAEAARIVVQTQIGSTSTIQRRLKLGYNRAGRIMDQLCERGVVGPTNGSKPREVKIQSHEVLEDLLDSLGQN